MPDPLDGFNVAAVAMTGSDVAYTIPDEVASFALHCPDGDLTLKSESGGSPWTILAGTKESFASRTVKNKTVYLNAASGLSVEVLLFHGTMDATH